MTESVHQQVLRPGGDIIGGAFPRSEPGRRPRPLPDRPQVTANIVEHRRDLLFGKLSAEGFKKFMGEIGVDGAADEDV